mmetsp:Transcript_21586/g.46951  ORF Transcript_21586/g.46951 Transcript_21586/m.46951 type:complete len:224 (-) Transcript_21586:797-1468(-)
MESLSYRLLERSPASAPKEFRCSADVVSLDPRLPSRPTLSEISGHAPYLVRCCCCPCRTVKTRTPRAFASSLGWPLESLRPTIEPGPQLYGWVPFATRMPFGTTAVMGPFQARTAAGGEGARTAAGVVAAVAVPAVDPGMRSPEAWPRLPLVVLLMVTLPPAEELGRGPDRILIIPGWFTGPSPGPSLGADGPRKLATEPPEGVGADAPPPGGGEWTRLCRCP